MLDHRSRNSCPSAQDGFPGRQEAEMSAATPICGAAVSNERESTWLRHQIQQLRQMPPRFTHLDIHCGNMNHADY